MREKYNPMSREGKSQRECMAAAARLRRVLQCAVWAAVVFVVVGCGYSVHQTLRTPFTETRGVFIPVFTNLTEETGAEVVFTNALIRELSSRGSVVLSSREAGALELRGHIVDISYGATVLTPTGFQGLQSYRRTPTELGLTVAIALELVEPGTQRVLWSGRFSGFQRVEAPIQRTHNYEAPSSVGVQTLSLIQSRYADVARNVMRDVYDDIVQF